MTAETSSEWTGYVCPVCRNIFRVPAGYALNAVGCPGCKKDLRLPGSGQAVPQLLSPLRKKSSSDSAGLGQGEHKTRRGSGTDNKLADWEKPRPPSKPWSRNSSYLLLFFSLGGLLVCVAATSYLILQNGRSMRSVGHTRGASSKLVDSQPSTKQPSMDSAKLRNNAEEITKKFFAAKTIDELKPLLRTTPSLEAALNRAYPDGKVALPKMKSFDLNNGVDLGGELPSVDILTDDAGMGGTGPARKVSFEQTDAGLKIDWEAFTGSSDLAWKDFLAKRVTQPTKFRVILEPSNYYNFEFNDDSQWAAFTLISPDGETMLYGYAPRESVVDYHAQKALVAGNALQQGNRAKVTTARVMLQCKAGSKSPNQVVITEWLGDGWVDEVQK